MEQGIIRAAVDNAAAKLGDAPRHDGEDWLPFKDIIASFRDVCHKERVPPSVEQRCYQVLLLMSAESEGKYTWWEKLRRLPFYISSLPKTSMFNDRTMGIYSSAAKPRSPSPSVIGLTEYAKKITPSRRLGSGTSPLVLKEGEELSIILNSTPLKPRNISFQSPVDRSYSEEKDDSLALSRSRARPEHMSQQRLKIADIYLNSLSEQTDLTTLQGENLPLSPIPHFATTQTSIRSPAVDLSVLQDDDDVVSKSSFNEFSMSLRNSAAMSKYLKRATDGAETASSLIATQTDPSSVRSSPSLYVASDDDALVSGSDARSPSPDQALSIRDLTNSAPRPRARPVPSSPAHTSSPGEEEQKQTDSSSEAPRGSFQALLSSIQTPGALDAQAINYIYKDVQADPHLLTQGIKVLMLFQKWLLSVCAVRRGDHFVSALFLHHLQAQPASNLHLYTLEHWLRLKMIEFLRREAAHVLLRQWKTFTGVNSQGRLYHTKQMLRSGYERWKEVDLRKRMRRRSPLHLFAERRYNSQELGANTSRAPTRAQAVFKALPLRHVMEKTHIYRAILRAGARHVDFMAEARSEEGRSLKEAEYRAAQDLAHLFISFRRFCSRTLLRRHAQLVYKRRVVRILCARWGTWRQCFEGADSVDQRRLLRADATYRHIMAERRRLAFYTLVKNISWSRASRQHLAKMRNEILARATCIRALYLLSLPVFVRCFFHWKENAESFGGLSKQVRALTRAVFRKTAFRRAISQWRSLTLRRQTGRYRAVVRDRRPDLVALTCRSVGVACAQRQGHLLLEPQAVSSRFTTRMVELSHLSRAFQALRTRRGRPRLFTSVMEMKFVHGIARCGAFDLSRQCRRLLSRMYEHTRSTVPDVVHVLHLDKTSGGVVLVQCPQQAFCAVDDQGAISSHQALRFVSATGPRLLDLYAKAASVKPAVSPSKSTLSVSAYLDLLASQPGLAGLAGPVAPFPRMQMAIRKWFVHTVHQRSQRKQLSSLRAVRSHYSLLHWFKLWRATYATVHHWRRRRAAQGFAALQQFCLSSRIAANAALASRRRLLQTSLLKLCAYREFHAGARAYKAAEFCNRVLDAQSGRSVFFLLYSQRDPQLRAFLSTTPSYRFPTSPPTVRPVPHARHPPTAPLCPQHHASVRLPMKNGKHLELTSAVMADRLTTASWTYRSICKAFERLRANGKTRTHHHAMVQTATVRKLRRTFEYLRRHRYFGRLRKALRLLKLRRMLTRWTLARVCVASRHARLRLMLGLWRRTYMRNVYSRVYDRAWGNKTRQALAQWARSCRWVAKCGETLARSHEKVLAAQALQRWQSTRRALKHETGAQRAAGWRALREHCARRKVARALRAVATEAFSVKVLRAWRTGASCRRDQDLAWRLGHWWLRSRRLAEYLYRLSPQLQGCDWTVPLDERRERVCNQMSAVAARRERTAPQRPRPRGGRTGDGRRGEQRAEWQPEEPWAGRSRARDRRVYDAPEDDELQPLRREGPPPELPREHLGRAEARSARRAEVELREGSGRAAEARPTRTKRSASTLIEPAQDRATKALLTPSHTVWHPQPPPTPKREAARAWEDREKSGDNFRALGFGGEGEDKDKDEDEDSDTQLSSPRAMEDRGSEGNADGGAGDLQTRTQPPRAWGRERAAGADRSLPPRAAASAQWASTWSSAPMPATRFLRADRVASPLRPRPLAQSLPRSQSQLGVPLSLAQSLPRPRGPRSTPASPAAPPIPVWTRNSPRAPYRSTLALDTSMASQLTPRDAGGPPSAGSFFRGADSPSIYFPDRLHTFVSGVSNRCVRAVAYPEQALQLRALQTWRARCAQRQRSEVAVVQLSRLAALRALRRLAQHAGQCAATRRQHERLQCRAFVARWINRVNAQRSARHTDRLVTHHHLVLRMKRLLRRWKAHGDQRRLLEGCRSEHARAHYRTRRLALAVLALKVPLQGSVRNCVATVVEEGLLRRAIERSTRRYNRAIDGDVPGDSEDVIAGGDADLGGLEYFKQLARQHHLESQRRRGSSGATGQRGRQRSPGPVSAGTTASGARLRASGLVFALTKRLLLGPK